MNDANFELLTGYATSAGTKKYANFAVKDKGSQLLTFDPLIICIYQV
jgi:hypothetical protein